MKSLNALLPTSDLLNMGRNEILSDSQTLIDASKAYVESGCSFNAVVISLLASDSFIYRK